MAVLGVDKTDSLIGLKLLDDSAVKFLNVLAIFLPELGILGD